MNYSENQTTTYGRKVVKGKRMKAKDYQKRLVLSWLICFAVGLAIGAVIICFINKTVYAEGNSPDAHYAETIDGKNIRIEIDIKDFKTDRTFIPLDVKMDEELQEFVFYLSDAYNIDFCYVMALMECESSFRPKVISTTNDYGLMQINQVNVEWLENTMGISNLLDPYQNIRAGMFILRQLFEKYNDPVKVLMCYNMGETGASRLWEQGVFETDYSNKILERQLEFQDEILRKEGIK